VASLSDLRRVALALPGVTEAPDGLAFSVKVKGKDKGFAWAWRERVHPKKPKVRNPGIFAVSVGSLSEKEIILGSDSNKFFTEPHYNGFPAVLVRLEAIEPDELEDLIIEAWRGKASPALAKQYDPN
jgi:hypothetical protein